MLGLCDRWHKLPPEVLAMDAGHLRLLEIVRIGTPEGGDQQYPTS